MPETLVKTGLTSEGYKPTHLPPPPLGELAVTHSSHVDPVDNKVTPILLLPPEEPGLVFPTPDNTGAIVNETIVTPTAPVAMIEGH